MQLLLSAVPVRAANNVFITEFMARNTAGITNNIDGGHSDWIEIYNADTDTVNLEGWYLTDNALLRTKWAFPATNIAPGQFMVIWASDKNRRTSGEPLHTNFKLADEGEYLALVWTNGETIVSEFAPTFPPQFPDLSYGVAGDNPTGHYLAWPTPGAPNSPATNFVVDSLRFWPPRGCFNSAVRVRIFGAAGVGIFYTLDGSLPGPTNGVLYTQPLTISKTTTIRAMGYRAGFTPSPPQSQTYIFLDQVLRQTGAGFPPTWGSNGVPASYALGTNIVDDPQWSGEITTDLLSIPTVSVAMNTEHLFGTNGIYANPLGEGVEWERECSVEYMPADCRAGFQVNCGIRIQGAASREPDFASKHNFRLLFKQLYGSGRLNFPLYAGSPVTEFETLVLHASFNDHWEWSGAFAQMHRDQWCADTQAEMGGRGTHGAYVHLYLNGLYWGLYNLGERPDASYAAHYLGGEKSDYDAFNTDELVDGNTNNWSAMLAIAEAGITNDAALASLGQYLDIPSFIDYLLVNFFGGTEDWPANNWRAAGSISNNIPFRFFSWDAEFTSGLSLYTGVAAVTVDRTGATNGTPGKLYAALRQNAEFRRLFGDRAQRHLFNDGVLTPDRTAARWMRRAGEIDHAIVPESARWGNFWYTNFTRNHWVTEQNRVLADWFPQRTGILVSQLRQAGLLPANDAPVLSPHGGIISNALPVTMTVSSGMIYYTTKGGDPRLASGAISPDALPYSGQIMVSDSLVLRARALDNDTNWSALVEADFVSIHEPAVLVGGIARLCGTAVEVVFSGRPRATHSLQTSVDLIHWMTTATLTADAEGFCRFTEPAATDSSGLFYRLRWP